SEYYADKYISTSGSGLQSTSGELAQITDAQLKARTLAVNRMLAEAHMMAAHGVIGVRVKASNFDFSTRRTEFTALGTAIKVPGLEGRKTVFTSDLNGQEFWQLYNAGYLPKELAFGVCSYYVKCDKATQQMIDPTLLDFVSGKSMANQEVPVFSQGFYDAREIAIDRLAHAAMAVHADGVVAAHVDYTLQTIEYQIIKTYHDLVWHLVATGTSIARDEKIPAATVDGRTKLYIDLKKNRSAEFDLESDYGFEPPGLSGELSLSEDDLDIDE